MRVTPFRALRYDPSVAGPDVETSAPAYDELDRFRYAAHRTSNPYTVLELITEGQRGAYDTARSTLDRWQRTGVVRADPRPALYLYEEHELRHGVPSVQRGVVGALDLADLDDGQLRLHEHVDGRRAEQRAQRLAAVPLDLTPVVAVHMGGAGPGLATAVADAHRQAPIVAFTDEVGIDHRVWRIDDVDLVGDVCAAYRGISAVLADGHHRVEAARRVRDRHVRAGTVGWGWAQTMVWLVDAEDAGPELRAVHREVATAVPRDADGAPRLAGFRALPWAGGEAGLPQAVADAPGLAYGLITNADAWILRADDSAALRAATAQDTGALLADLDAQVLASVVLPMLGDPPVQAVFDVARAAADLRRAGRGSLFVLQPPSASQVMAIASAGERMPAKTTWFRPKPRAGLIMRRLDVDDGSMPAVTLR